MTTLAPAPRGVVEVEPDEAAARRDLRTQIARLEARLQQRAPGVGGGAGPRLLGLAELSDVRNDLVAREAAEMAVRTEDADSVAYHRNLLEEAFTDPRRHRGLRIPLKALGEPGCGVYQVKPRLGIVGMLAGWWEITLSSGCP